MKKSILSAFIALATAATALTFTSCSLFEGDGFDEKTVGNLDRTRAESDLPSGYRIKTVGDIRFIYKTNGKLDIIRIGGQDFDVNKKSLTINEDGDVQKYTFTFNSDNLLTKVKSTWHVEDNDEVKGDNTAELSYNSDKQLTKITSSGTTINFENNKEIKTSYKATHEFTYNDMRLRRIKQKFEEKRTVDGETDKTTYTATIGFDYDYDEDSYNRYYQWTPNVVKYGLAAESNDLLAAMAYVGMLGRASSLLPESINVEENDEGEEDNFTKYCSYSHNSYDAISKADGVSYSYTEKDDDYEVKGYVGDITPRLSRKLFDVHRSAK